MLIELIEISQNASFSRDFKFINPLKLHNREFKMLWFEISSTRVGRAESLTWANKVDQETKVDTDIFFILVRQRHGTFK